MNFDIVYVHEQTHSQTEIFCSINIFTNFQSNNLRSIQRRSTATLMFLAFTESVLYTPESRSFQQTLVQEIQECIEWIPHKLETPNLHGTYPRCSTTYPPNLVSLVCTGSSLHTLPVLHVWRGLDLQGPNNRSPKRCLQESAFWRNDRSPIYRDQFPHLGLSS